MKSKNILLLFTLFFLFNCSKKDLVIEESSGCSGRNYYGNLVFSTQKEIDNFNRLGYESIHGSIEILGNNLDDPIRSLEGLLTCVRYIELGVSITLNDSLENIDNFLENVTSLKYLNISNNKKLSLLGAFNNLISVEGPLVIKDNKVLQTLNGFSNLTSINRLFIHNNDSLLNLGEFNSLINISSEIVITRNQKLQNIDAISSNKNQKLENVFIQINPSLENLRGLINISTVNVISINSNDNLIDLDGLQNLKYANEFNRNGVYLYSNKNLKNIDALSNMIRTKEIEIHNNMNLSDFCGIGHLVNSNSYSFLGITGNLYNPTLNNFLSGQCK